MRSNQRIAIVVLTLCCVAGFAANQTTSAQDDQELTPASLFGGGQNSMFDHLFKAALKGMDTTLDHLAKPDTTAKMARYQKNYYDALVNEGFTPQQAFSLVEAGGNPLSNVPRASK